MFANAFTAAAAAAAFIGTANAHMIMATPKPFGGPELDNSPLTSANYPCKLQGNPATFYNREGLTTTMAIGETQTLSFKGSAVHGGGSCQLAVTKDLQPSVSTSWQVILSIEGGCPSKDGQGPSTYDFTIPDSIAPGDYIFTFTWQSKLAGLPEFYMNCAPITVTGGAGKRSEGNETMAIASREELPELFVANLAEINSCKTTPGTDPQYPNPGPNVIRPGSNNNFAKVEGSDCVPKGASSGGSSSGSGPGSDGSGANGGSDSAGSGSGSAPATSAAAAAPSAPAAAPSSSAPAAAPPASSGFMTSVKPASSSAAAPEASSAPAAAPSSAAASAAPSSPPFPITNSTTTGSGSGPAAGGLTGTCTDEGMFNCVGGSSYQQCASGAWTKMTELPAGTKCAEGQTMNLWA